MAVTPDEFGKSSHSGFLENKGQIIDQHNKANPDVLYLLNTPGFNVQLKKDGFSYDIYETTSFKNDSLSLGRCISRKFHRIDIRFIDPEPDFYIETSGESNEYINYYTTGTGPDGAFGVRHYQKIVYKNIFYNVDLEFTIDPENEFKYCYVIRPGGKIESIRFSVSGSSGKIKNGSLVLSTDWGSLIDDIPYSYLLHDENRESVSVNFHKLSENIFGFKTQTPLSLTSTLIIDPIPTRRWGTYFGGLQFDDVITEKSSTVDRSNNLIVCGIAWSTTNIATSGAYQTVNAGYSDSYVAKFSSDGSIIWATYFGGPGGEYFPSVSSDNMENIYLSGGTNSSTAIATPGAFQTNLAGGEDAFAAKFNSSGQRIWATYYGGPDYELVANSCLDSSGDLYIIGTTASSTNIATPGAHQVTYGGGSSDVFLCKFSKNGFRLWSTYYGGEKFDENPSCTTDSLNHIYICGTTMSTTNISTPGSMNPVFLGQSDGFFAAFDSVGNRLWGTYYGGTLGDDISDISSDSAGNLYFIGASASPTGIATVGAFQPNLTNTANLCIGALNPLGERIWGSYYGGGGESPSRCYIDSRKGAVYYSGWSDNSSSISLLVSSGAYQTVWGGGGSDAFMAKFDINGQRIWGSLYGGSGLDYGFSIIPDTTDDFYLSGYTYSPDNIATRNGYIPTLQGWTDAFIVKFADCWSPDTANFIVGPPAVCEFTNGLIYSIDSIPYASSYQWRTSANLSIVSGQGTDSITVNVLSGGSTDTVTIFGINSCGQGLEKYLLIDIKSRPTAISLLGVDSICSGIPATFTTNPGKSNYSWNWSAGGALISGGSATDSAITLSWNTSGIHWVSVNYDDTNGCSAIDPVVHQIVITGDSTVDITIQSSANNLCAGTPVTFTATPVNGGTAPVYQWQVNGINTGTDNPGFTYTPSNGDLVTCILTSSQTVCISNNPATSNTITMTVNPNLPVSVGVSATADTVCEGTPVTFTATPVNGGISPVYQWQVNGINAGTNSASYMYAPSNGDLVTCILTSSEICTTNNPANSIPITVTVKPYLPVSITVTPSENPFCPGSSVTFSTTSTNGGVSPQYQWQVNGVNAGTNNPAFSYIPSNGDLVTCILASSELCTTNNPAAGNVIILQENTSLPAGVAITATPNPFCPGTSVTLTATPVNGGTAPVYQWKVNGNNAGTNANVFTCTPSNNDSISCLLTSNLACVSNNPAYSNRIVMNAAAVPVVSFTPCFDTITTTNAKPIKLKGGIPLGGTYSGAGVTGNVYYPSVAGIGTHLITYSYTNAALCSATASLTIHQVAASTVPCGQPFTDIRDGAVYQTISLGSQCWMAEDLRYGNKILSSIHQTDNCRPEKYTHPEAVYQWDELMAYDPTPAGQGLCPPGWHVPTEADWNALFANWTNNGFAGSPLKYSGFSGFDAILSGARHHTVQWDYAGFAVFCWSSTAHGPFKAWAHGMNEADPSVSTYPAARSNAFGVRCVRD